MAGNDASKKLDKHHHQASHHENISPQNNHGEHHSSKNHEEKIDGSYIMHHIHDDRVFEFFNPFDWNDNNHDHYYYTKKNPT